MATRAVLAEAMFMCILLSIQKELMRLGNALSDWRNNFRRLKPLKAGF